jgi:hypothetical protein
VAESLLGKGQCTGGSVTVSQGVVYRWQCTSGRVNQGAVYRCQPSVSVEVSIIIIGKQSPKLCSFMTDGKYYYYYQSA